MSLEQKYFPYKAFTMQSDGNINLGIEHELNFSDFVLACKDVTVLSWMNTEADRVEQH